MTEVNQFFQKQEEVDIADFSRQAEDARVKTRDVRKQLAESFLAKMHRVARSYDNQIVAYQFALSFRILARPLVDKAVGYFYEKRLLRRLVNVARRGHKALVNAMVCTRLYHQNVGFQWIRKFALKKAASRSEHTTSIVRRRAVILSLFPYFNWTEILPVRPPRPLKEVAAAHKDLPMELIQRKVALERIHHVNVKLLLMKRRMMRDFVRGWASYVQNQVAVRAVFGLLKTKRSLRMMVDGMNGFRKNAGKEAMGSRVVMAIDADIEAWFSQFFKVRNRQNKMANGMPWS
jgi:hypothetical protein